MPKKFFILLFAVFLLPTLIYAQAGQTGAINSVVRTPEGDPIPGVTVILESPALVIPSLDTVTKKNGGDSEFASPYQRIKALKSSLNVP